MQLSGKVVSIEKSGETKTDVRVTVDVDGRGFSFVSPKGGFTVDDNVVIDITVV